MANLPSHAVNELRESLAGRLLLDSESVAPFLTDYRGRWTGSALAVAEPSTVIEVQTVARWCAKYGVPIVPQGGNTGLSGGSVPDATGTALLVSLRKLDRIRNVDGAGGTLVVEAGVTLQRAQEAAAEAGYLLPLSLAAEGSCTIGGNLATNAGGTQTLRFGNARELCLGLEVVTPSGELWDGLRCLRKDNTGYDLRDLYIGSEGTLGIITAAVLRLSPSPRSRTAALVALSSTADALRLLGIAQQHLASALTAFELFSHSCLDIVLRNVPGSRAPFEQHSPWYVLIESASTGEEAAAQEQVEQFLADAIELSSCTDALVSTSIAQFEAFWSLREHISDAQSLEGPTIKHDISLPIASIPLFIERTEHSINERFPQVALVVFGHLGDGNIHYNLSPRVGSTIDKAGFLALEPELNRLVHDAVIALRGSISAEHGLGVLRASESARYKSSVELALMHSIKDALDPFGLMNPGKVLPR